MLLIRCAACKAKLWKYYKVGPGEVLRCHKSRISKIFKAIEDGDKIKCRCGKTMGIDKGGYYKMIGKAFTYGGTKNNSGGAKRKFSRK